MDNGYFSGFTKGMGIGGWLTNYKRFHVLQEERRLVLTQGDFEHFDSYIAERDVEYIASLGLDHVRVCFDQLVVEEAEGILRERTARKLDEFIGWCGKHKLNVVLNMHKAIGNYCDVREPVQLLDDEGLQRRFIRVWEAFEDRYAAIPGVAFEILNEIKDVDPEKWNDLAERTIGAIRAKNPERLVIVGSACWNSPHRLASLRVWDDPRVAYTFHVYAPFIFTHQRGVLQEWPLYHNLEMAYPSDDVVRYKSAGENCAGLPRMDRKFLEAVLKPAFDFVAAHPDKVLWCGEFGTIRHAKTAYRENWMRDVISLLKEHGIPYSVWNYLSTPNDGNRFSLVDDDNRRIVSENMARIIRGDIENDAAEIKVDFAAAKGPVKPVNGVGQGPILGWNDCSMFHYLKEAGIPYARLHDTGGAFGKNLFVDIPNLFRDFNADENDPASYDFTFTDGLLKAFVENGVEPYFRLGVTIENVHRVKAYRVFPPKDYAKWARICEHVVRHYNEGWADGSRLGITYWEIWNEADNSPEPEGNPMWKGSFDEYMKLYETTAKHLKAQFPAIKVGGYAGCGFYAVTGGFGWEEAHCDPRTKYFVECYLRFLDFVKATESPLDFFSFHSYDTPDRVARQIAFAAQKLREAGFAKTELHFNEWLPGAWLGGLGSAIQAGRIAAELAMLQESPVDVACLYDARCQASPYSPLFNAITREPYRAYAAFLAFNELRKLGTSVASSATCAAGGVYATAAADGKGRGAILVANCGEKDVPLRLDLGDASVVAARIIDERNALAPVPLPDWLPANTVLLAEAETASGGR